MAKWRPVAAQPCSEGRGPHAPAFLLSRSARRRRSNCPVVSTMRKRASPLIILSKARRITPTGPPRLSAARLTKRSSKASVSCASIEEVHACPTIERLAPIRSNGATSILVVCRRRPPRGGPRTARPGTECPRLAAGHRRQDCLRAAKFHQLRRHVLRLAVEIDVGAEFARERLLVLAAGDGDSTESHLGGELHTEMAKPADAVDSDKVTGPGAALAQGVVGISPCRASGASSRAKAHRGSRPARRRARPSPRNSRRRR